MLIRDCMTRHVELVSPSATVADAARLMLEKDFGILPVHENDRLIGMISDRDIAIRLVAEGKDPFLALVRDIMSPKVLYCFDDQEVSEAARSMAESRVRRLPVLNREKRLVGIISLGDLSCAKETGNIQEALRRISLPDRHHDGLGATA